MNIIKKIKLLLCAIMFISVNDSNSAPKQSTKSAQTKVAALKAAASKKVASAKKETAPGADAESSAPAPEKDIFEVVHVKNITPLIVKQKPTARFLDSTIFTSEMNFIIYILFTDSYMIELLKKYIENNVIITEMNKKIWDYIESIITSLYEKDILKTPEGTKKQDKIQAILEELIKLFPKLMAHFEEQIRGLDAAGMRKFLNDDLYAHLNYFESQNTATSQMMFMLPDMLVEHSGQLRTEHVKALVNKPEKLQDLMQIVLELEETEKKIKMIDVYEIQVKLFDSFQSQLHASSALTTAHSFISKHVLPSGFWGWTKLIASMGYRIGLYNVLDSGKTSKNAFQNSENLSTSAAVLKFIGVNPWREIIFDRVNNIFDSMTMNANYFLTGRPFVSRNGFFKPLLGQHYTDKDNDDNNDKFSLERKASDDIEETMKMIKTPENVLRGKEEKLKTLEHNLDPNNARWKRQTYDTYDENDRKYKDIQLTTDEKNNPQNYTMALGKEINNFKENMNNLSLYTPEQLADIKKSKEKYVDLIDSIFHSYGFFGARKNILDLISFNGAISSHEINTLKMALNTITKTVASSYNLISSILLEFKKENNKRTNPLQIAQEFFNPIRDSIFGELSDKTEKFTNTSDKLTYDELKQNEHYNSVVKRSVELAKLNFDIMKKLGFKDEYLKSIEFKNKKQEFMNKIKELEYKKNNENDQSKIDSINLEIQKIDDKINSVDKEQDTYYTKTLRQKFNSNKEYQEYLEKIKDAYSEHIGTLVIPFISSLGYIKSVITTYDTLKTVKNTYDDYKRLFEPYKNYISLQNKKIALTKKLMVAFSEFMKASNITVDLPEFYIIKHMFKNIGSNIDNAVGFSNGGTAMMLIKQHLAPAKFLYDFKTNVSDYFNLNFDNDFIKAYGSEYTFSIIWKLIHKFIATVKILCHNAYLVHGKVTNQTVQYCTPTLVNDDIIFEAKDMCIPGNNGKKVLNNISLGAKFHNRNMLVTSPIGSGKTYSIINILMSAYLAQIGIVPAKEAILSAFDNIIQSMNHIYVPAKGDISKNMGERIFTKSIQEKITGPILLLLDEFFSGTMPEQALYLTMSIVASYWQNLNVIGIYTTHFPEIRNYVMENKELFGVKNAYIEVLQDKDKPTSFTRTHKLKFDDENGANWWFQKDAKEKRFYYNRFISEEENKSLERIKQLQLQTLQHARTKPEDKGIKGDAAAAAAAA